MAEQDVLRTYLTADALRQIPHNHRTSQIPEDHMVHHSIPAARPNIRPRIQYHTRTQDQANRHNFERPHSRDRA